MIDAKRYMDICEQQSRQIADLTKALREEVEITSLTARLAQNLLAERDAARAEIERLRADAERDAARITWYFADQTLDEWRASVDAARATAAPGDGHVA